MPTVTDQPVARRIADLRDQIANIEAQAATDTVAGAPDLDAWRDRDERRRDARVQLEATLRRLELLGDIVDDPDLEAAVGEYLVETQEARAALGRLVREQRWARTGGGGESNSVVLLQRWWGRLHRLAGLIPEFHEDGQRFLNSQLRDWFSARQTWLVLCARDRGADVPEPELTGQLGDRGAFGFYRDGGR